MKRVDAFTQTERLAIQNNSDMGLEDLSLILIISAFIKLQELLSILIYYDHILGRPIRLLSLYMKFVVMLLIASVFYTESNIVMAILYTQILAEISSCILKITRS